MNEPVIARNHTVAADNARNRNVWKRWLSPTSLIDGLVYQEVINRGDMLIIYFNEYSTKTKYPDRSWYIEPILYKTDNDPYMYPDELRNIFPGFKYLNLTKKSLINPDRIKHTRVNPNKIWKLEIDTEGKEFIGSDGEPHTYFKARMSYVPKEDMYDDDRKIEYIR